MCAAFFVCFIVGLCFFLFFFFNTDTRESIFMCVHMCMQEVLLC